MACEFFPTRGGTTVVDVGVNGESATGKEFAPNFNIARGHELDEVFHDDVNAVFMEGAMVAEAKEVELEALAFNHLLVGDVANVDGGEVGLAGDGAEGGEFWAVEFDKVVIFLVAIFKGFEDRRGVFIAVDG